jgi:glycosyltransferase involved in cell wall biosynthesis
MEPTAPGISVVVCAYTEDRWEDLTRALASVSRQTRPPLETILVADHNEALRARVAAAFPEVRTIANTGRQGLSDARNAGVAAATGAVVATPTAIRP